MEHLLLHGFYNVGMTNQFVMIDNTVEKQLYTFTHKFVLDLQCVFRPLGAGSTSLAESGLPCWGGSGTGGFPLACVRRRTSP